MGRPRSEIYKMLEPSDVEGPDAEYEYGYWARLPNRRIELWREPDGSVILITKRLLSDRRIGYMSTQYTREAADTIEHMLTLTRTGEGRKQ
jgi:hypothetical protein